MNQLQDQSGYHKFEEENSLINYERIWYRVLRYWYVVVVSILLAFFVVFAYNRYTTKIYPLSSSIIIKESEEAGQTAEILYNNPLINSYRNFLNEPYIIRSFPLLRQVVDSLGFSVVIYGEGNIKKSELYNQLPIKISGNKKNNIYLNASFDFIIQNNQQFKLVRFPQSVGNEEQVQMEFVGTFNDTLQIDEFSILIEASNFSEEVFDKKFSIKFLDGFDLAQQYAGRLKVDWAEEGASVINLSLTTSLLQKELNFLATLIGIYSLQDENKKKEVAHNSKLFIDWQLQSISDSLLLIEKQLESFKDVNTLTNLNEQTSQILYKIDELESTRSSYILKRKYYDYLTSYLKDTNNMNHVILPTTMGVMDPILTELIGQLVELQLQLKQINSTTTQGNPMIREIGRAHV